VSICNSPNQCRPMAPIKYDMRSTKTKMWKKIKKYKNAKFDRFRPRRRFGIVGVVLG